MILRAPPARYTAKMEASLNRKIRSSSVQWVGAPGSRDHPLPGVVACHLFFVGPVPAAEPTDRKTTFATASGSVSILLLPPISRAVPERKGCEKRARSENKSPLLFGSLDDAEGRSIQIRKESFPKRKLRKPSSPRRGMALFHERARRRFCAITIMKKPRLTRDKWKKGGRQRPAMFRRTKRRLRRKPIPFFLPRLRFFFCKLRREIRGSQSVGPRVENSDEARKRQNISRRSA